MDAFSWPFLTNKVRARAAFVTCLAATLIVVGALTRIFGGQFAVAPQILDVAIVNGFPGAEDAIVRGTAAVRVLPAARRIGPALDSSSSAASVPTAVVSGIWAVADDLEGRLDVGVAADSVLRFAHRPRAPPNHAGNVDQLAHFARLQIVMSCNCGANPPGGLHRT